MTELAIGEEVWVDEGDAAGCYEFGGVVKEIGESDVLIEVTSTPVVAGYRPGTLRRVPFDLIVS